MFRFSSDDKVVQRITLFPDTTYKPKLTNTPSIRAITNYYNMPTDLPSTTSPLPAYDNYSFVPEDSRYVEPYGASATTSCTSSLPSTLDRTASVAGSRHRASSTSANDEYEYAAFGSENRIYYGGSEVGSERRDDVGSTSRLVSQRMRTNCQTWFSHVETFICTLSLAASFGNLYRLPQSTLLRGELPFLVAYLIISVFIGFPLLFLELGVGQLAQEGFIKIWRAVPFFKGVGYVKLAAGCLLVIYYPLYMALCLYYIVWLGKEEVPFSECASVTLTENGYVANGKSGRECIQKTFLQSPYVEPKWFGSYAMILFFVWTILVFLSFKRTRSFVKALVVLFFPLLAFYIALLVKAAMTTPNDGLEKFFTNNDWSKLAGADVWYYATIQVFFSTNIGFGAFVTSAGVIYNKVNPLGMAVLYTIANLIFGIGFTVLFFVISKDLPVTPVKGSTTELHFITLIYDNAIKNSTDLHDMRIWTAQVYSLMFFAGCISMVFFIYTLLKVIEIETKRLLNWWQTTIIIGLLGFLFGVGALLMPHFEVVRLLDHYIVGNLILLSVIIEVLAFIIFYSVKRLQLDFEFILGRRLTKTWYALWWFAPFALLLCFVWALAKLPLAGNLKVDPEWVYGIGWGTILSALVFILVIGVVTISKQEEFFTFGDKLKATLKPSRKWGPVDPILRYNWVQWHSKAKEGERDFTLKRRGTKDYTHSIKKSNKSGHQTSSDLSTTSASGVYHKNDQNQNSIRFANSTYVEPYRNRQRSSPNLVQTNGDMQLRVTSLVDSFDPPLVHMYINDQVTHTRAGLNPLGRPNMYSDPVNECSNSEGYGTFRKGPYVINDDMGHICHRKYDQHIEATSL